VINERKAAASSAPGLGLTKLFYGRNQLKKPLNQAKLGLSSQHGTATQGAGASAG